MSLHKQHWLLLAVLAKGQALHVSQLSKQVGVKPHQLNSLWQQMPKHIKELLCQQDGLWRLIKPIAIFSAEQTKLIGQRHGFQVALEHECTSSNDILLSQTRQNATDIHRQVCITHSQSAGRGQQGRTWQHRLGECLMFSLAWSFPQPQHQLSALTLTVALACYRSLNKLGIKVQIKWPNDLVIGNLKLGGILIETVRQESKTVAIIGIGINFMAPKSMKQATSIQAASSHLSLTADDVLESLLSELGMLLPQFERNGFTPLLADYEVANRDTDHNVRLLHNNQLFAEGRVIGVTAQGALRLATPIGEREIVSGEISLRRDSEPKPIEAAAHKRYLLLDGGNSQLKWAWVHNGNITDIGRAPYRNLSQLGEEWQKHNALIDDIIGCAVCGEIKKQLVTEQLSSLITWLPSMAQGLGIRNHYRSPEEHGSDRWFNALGARRFSNNACIVVSCGTAVTIDALTSDNHYLGGTIMPGFHLMKEAMAQKTANLNRQIGKIYPFPTTTSNAIASGMMDAVCGSIMLMHGRLKEREGANNLVDIIITGGGAAKVVQALPASFSLDNTVKIVDNLVIYGLLHWVLEGIKPT